MPTVVKPRRRLDCDEIGDSRDERIRELLELRSEGRREIRRRLEAVPALKFRYRGEIPLRELEKVAPPAR